MRFPSPPVVSATISGFVVGVFATLLATGIVNHATSHSQTPPLPTPVGLQTSALYSRVWNLTTHTLGAYTNRKQARLISIKLVRVHSLESVADPQTDFQIYRSVSIDFRLNDHPLGKSWRLKAAKADVFTVMKALYTSDLPVYDIELVGHFPLPEGKKLVDADAVIAYETHNRASQIPWKNWGRENEARLWNELPYKSVDPRFA